jgi:hypothetical protein
MRSDLAVLATGWIDFTKDLLQFWHPTDVDGVASATAHAFVGRLPWRLLAGDLCGRGDAWSGWRSAFARVRRPVPLRRGSTGWRALLGGRPIRFAQLAIATETRASSFAPYRRTGATSGW